MEKNFIFVCVCLGVFGMASKQTADIVDQAKDTYDEYAGKAKEAVEKRKKDIESL